MDQNTDQSSVQSDVVTSQSNNRGNKARPIFPSFDGNPAQYSGWKRAFLAAMRLHLGHKAVSWKRSVSSYTFSEEDESEIWSFLEMYTKGKANKILLIVAQKQPQERGSDVFKHFDAKFTSNLRQRKTRLVLKLAQTKMKNSITGFLDEFNQTVRDLQEINVPMSVDLEIGLKMNGLSSRLYDLVIVRNPDTVEDLDNFLIQISMGDKRRQQQNENTPPTTNVSNHVQTPLNVNSNTFLSPREKKAERLKQERRCFRCAEQGHGSAKCNVPATQECTKCHRQGHTAPACLNTA